MSKHIIIGQSTNINVFSWLLFSSSWERERGIQNLGIKEKCPQSYLSYFSTGFHWRIFPLSRANRLCSIFLHWLEEPGVPLVSVILLSSTRSKMAKVRLPATDPAQKLAFLLFTSAEGKGPPLPFWGPSQSFGFSLLPLGVRWPEVTKYQHLLIPLCDLHSSLTVTFFWWLDTVNSTGG